MSNQVFAVVLAGGSGSRLWPLSRQHLPKQFLSLDGSESLLESTVRRLGSVVNPEDVWIVSGEGHASGEAYESLVHYKRILEPVGRNTAPAIALSAALLQDESGIDPVLVVLPADHMIRNEEVFRERLQVAVDAARKGSLITFGIRPTRADTGFGYIRAQVGGEGEVLDVERFMEKPDEAMAEHFIQDGNYYWNSGMFVWKASAILEEMRMYLPDVHTHIEKMRTAWRAGESWRDVVHREFAAMPDVSVDYGVLEHSQHVQLVPCDIGWSDVGTWDAVYEVAGKDDNGNAIDGDVLAIGCQNSLLRSEHRLMAAVGVEDLIAVETADAVLLSKRGESQRVREVVEVLKQRGGSEYLEHLTVRRPWGGYTVLDDRASGYKLKRIDVKPGGSLSLQSHQHRSEHWVVVSGTATVTRDGKTFTVEKNESTYIPIGMKHRLQNCGKSPLQIVEVQVGEYLGEDDIERFDDVYGREE